jgi:hypothetical protein
MPSLGAIRNQKMTLAGSPQSFRFLSLLLLVSTGFFLNAWLSDAKEQELASLSHAPGKLSKFVEEAPMGFAGAKSYRKPSSFLPIAFYSLSGEVTSAQNRIEIEGVVEPATDLEDVQYEWLIPSGITANGPTKGWLGSVRHGEPIRLSLVGVSETSENRTIALHVYRMVDGKAIGQIGHFNTIEPRHLKKEAQLKTTEFQKTFAPDERVKIYQ